MNFFRTPAKPEEPTISYRPIIVDDVPRIIELYREYSEQELALGKLAEFINHYPSQLAERGDVLVGFAYSGPFAPDIIELMNIHVRMPERNNRVGSFMLANLERLAFQKKGGIVAVNSGLYEAKVDKSPATNFYLKNGYKIIMSTAETNVFGKLKTDI